MNPLLISGFGNFVSCENRKLVVVNAIEKTRQEYYMHNLPFDNLVVDSHTGNISWQAVRFLIKHNVVITTLNWNGNLLSVTLPAAPLSSKLRIKQYEAYLDQDKRYYIAHTIVREKIKQSLNLLREMSRYYKEININEIEAAFNKEDKFYRSSNVDALMVFEAKCSCIYWESFIKVANKLYPEFNFKSRNNSLNSHNRNAADEINALLNYGYALLESEVKKDMNSIGLDPTISSLHELADRASLTYDLMELARSWAVDLSVLRLLEDRVLKKSDFIVSENFNIRLRERAAKLLINKMKETMNSRATYKNAQFKYQNILFNNVRILANYISGKQDKLEFNIPLIQIKRNDELPLRDRIANMSVAERKARKINKSTLWYQKLAIKNSAKRKIYAKVLNKLDGIVPG